MFKRQLVPVYLPEGLYSALRRAKRTVIPPADVEVTADISGERNIEWNFLSANLPPGPGDALEFGCEHAYMSLQAAMKGYRVLATDLGEQHFGWKHPNVEFRMGDFLTLDFSREHFNVIINCSSVEHVGVPGRYGITEERADGDLAVMEKFAQLLRPEGAVLMTVPVGVDTVMAPWCRVYGERRLPQLLAPFEIAREQYWIKDRTNEWVSAERSVATSFVARHDAVNPHGCSYALGGFVLRKRH